MPKTAQAGAWTAALEPNTPANGPVDAAGHWIEIELIGEDGNPIPHEVFLIALPDGTRIEGTLDAGGFVRLDRLSAGGTCQVSFPRLDASAWEFIQTSSARAAA